MSKKLTLFMVAVMAMLFTAPVQAQTAMKEMKKATRTFKATPSLTESQKAKMLDSWRQNMDKKAKASAAQDAGIPFQASTALRVNTTAKSEVDPKQAEIQQANSLVKTTFSGIRHEASAKVWGYANQLLTGLYNTNIPRTAGAAEGEVKDVNGIITTPAEGEHKFYTRAGDNYYVSNQQLYIGTQSGNVEIVECSDGTIYIKDPVSTYAQGTWAKGTKAGNTITVPAHQPMGYNNSYATTLSLRWAVVNAAGSSSAADDHADNFTYTVDGDVITLQGTAIYNGATDTYCMGIVWDDDNSFSGYGDANSVYTLSEGYEPASTDPIVPPVGMTTETWNVKFDAASSSGSTTKVGTANVGFIGNEVYVQGLFQDFPEAWIKGTIDGTDVTFSKFQFLGTYSTYNIWMVGATYDGEAQTNGLDDFKMVYDADNKVLTAVNDVLANAAEDRIYYLSWSENVIIQEAEFEEEAVATGEPVDILPYVNTFENEADEPQFGVIDANNDGYAWTLYTTEDDPTVSYRLRWNSSLDADDWLVSPAIKMEAGKAYHFSIQAKAQSASYPERIEVKLAAEAKASVLAEGVSVIAPTDVTWAAFQKLENEFVTVSEAGFYHFGIHGISDADTYYLSVTEFVVEEGADPNAPDAVTGLTVTPKDGVRGADIAFTAPAKAVSGADLTSNLKIEIARNLEIIKTFENVAPGTALSYEDVDPALTNGYYEYVVVASNEAGAGKKSEAITVYLSEPIEAPYFADFTVENTAYDFVVIDNNEDGSTWNWSASNYAYYKYNSNNTGDDYLVTLPIKAKAGKVFEVKVEVAAQSTTYPERFEVKAGVEASAEGLNIDVIPVTDVTEKEFVEYTGSFTAPADGFVYVAIHAISDPDMYYLKVKSISIESPDPLAPVAPVLTVTPDAQGGLTAEVEVTAPTTSINGEALTGNVKIVVTRDGEAVKTFESIAPGATISFTDAVAADTTYTYQAKPSNAFGIGKLTEKVTVFIGTDIPLAPENFMANDAANSILFSWEAVTEGVNGGYVLPVKYNLYDATVESSLFGSYLVLADEPFAAGVEGTSVNREDYNADEGEQGYTYFAIKSENSRGESEDFNYTAALTGAPYELPVIEGFKDNSLHYFWTYENAELFISHESSDGDGTALMMVNMEDPTAFSAFVSGKLNTKGLSNPTLVFDVKTESPASKLLVLGRKSAEDYNLLTDYIPMTKEYTTVKVPLKDVQDERFTQIAFLAQLPNLTTEEIDWSSYSYYYIFGDSIVFDNIRIVNLLKYDVQVKEMTAPAKVNAGENIDLAYTIENVGEEAANDVIVEVFYKDGENRDEKVLKTDTISLASFEKKEFTLVAPTSVFTGTEAEFRVVATFANDLNIENDEMGMVVSVKQSTLPAPMDVVLETPDLTNAKSATISWTAPEPIVGVPATAAAVTEDFEDQSIFAPGSTGGITDVQHTGAFGDWTLYDGNGITVYGWQNYSVPGIGDPSAWVVMNPAQVGEDFASNYVPASGSQFLISMCPADNSGTPAADHWLISPALSGAAQTISFYAREITTSYGAETFEVLASSTTNDVESFTRVASLSSASTAWEEFTVDLPAGTKYFAIRHTAQDIFGLLIDDITYIPAGGGSDIALSSTVLTGYNIYVDHDFTVNAKASQTETTFPHRFKGTEKIFVTAVYNLIDEAMPIIADQYESAPVMAIGDITGIENLIVNSGKNVNIYTMDGKLIRSNANNLRKGVYVVDGKKVVK